MQHAKKKKKKNCITDSFNKYYLLSLSGPGTVLATRDKVIDKNKHSSGPLVASGLVRETVINQIIPQNVK